MLKERSPGSATKTLGSPLITVFEFRMEFSHSLFVQFAVFVTDSNPIKMVPMWSNVDSNNPKRFLDFENAAVSG